MDFEKEIVKYSGFMGAFVGIFLSLYRLFKFFVTRYLAEFKIKLEGLKEDFEDYKIVNDKTIGSVLKNSNHMEVQECIKDLKETQKNIIRLFDKAGETAERISSLEGYIKGKDKD